MWIKWIGLFCSLVSALPADVPFSDSMDIYASLETASIADTVSTISSIPQDPPLYTAARSIFRSMGMMVRVAYINTTTLQPISVVDKQDIRQSDLMTLLKGNLLNKKLMYGVCEASSLIGKGISGSVYRGWNLGQSTLVALKKSVKLGSHEEKCAEKMGLLLSDDIPEYTTSGTAWLPLKYIPHSRRLSHVLLDTQSDIPLVDLYHKAKSELEKLHQQDYCHGDAHVGNFLVINPDIYSEPDDAGNDDQVQKGDVVAIDFDQCFKCHRMRDQMDDFHVLIKGMERTIMTSRLKHTEQAEQLMELLYKEKKRLKQLEKL